MIDTLYTIYTSYDKLLQYDIKHDTSKLLYCTAISRIDSCSDKITQYNITDQDLTNLYRIRKILWNRLCANGWDVNYERAVTYKITAVPGTGYTITPTGTATVQQGASKTYTVTATSGYSLTNLIIDGVNVTANTTYTFSNVTANHTIAAVATAIEVASMYYGYITQAQANLTAENSTTWTYSDLTSSSLSGGVASGTLVKTDVSTLSKTAINLVPEGDFILIAIPKASNLVCTKDNGIGGKVIWYTDVGTTYQANGLDLVIDGITYDIFGELSTVEGTRYIYINNQ